MIFAALYILIGSAVSYFMQSQIRWLSHRITKHTWLQTVLKIVFDAAIGFTWLISAPALCALRVYYQNKDNQDDEK